MSTNIYILRLEGGRFYIGKSNNITTRYQEHLNGNGSAWTRLYKPISLDRIIPNASPFDEDKYTKEYMSKYGIDKVRGGSYVQVALSEADRRSIEKEIWGAKNACTNCGRTNHFVVDCYARTDICGNTIGEDYEDEDDDEDDYEDEDDDEDDYDEEDDD
jgi:predicted GIY-YIG superfamily endonuclease